MDYFSQIKTLLRISLVCGYFLSPVWSDITQVAQASHFAKPSKIIKGYLLMDAKSGQIIKASDPINTPLPPASLTKLMTMYVLADALRKNKIQLNEPVKISQKASQMEGSRMFIAPHSQVAVKDLIQGMIIQSGNDASVALAEHVAGTEERFVSLMNQIATHLNMQNTHYVNVSGLPCKNHYMSLLDIAKLAQATIADFPEYYTWYSQKSFCYSNIFQKNRNRLLWLDATVDGIKTGETKEAGYCLAASAKREDMRLIAIVMGAPSKAAREEVAKRLLDDGFRLFTSYQYNKANHVLIRSIVWGAKQWKASIGLRHDLYVTMPRDKAHLITQRFLLHKPIIAPLSKNTVVGEVQLLLENKCLVKAPLVLLKAIEEGHWLKKQLAVLFMGSF